MTGPGRGSRRTGPRRKADRRGTVLPPFLDRLKTSLDSAWKAYKEEVKRCRKRPSETNIHNLRVAIRRFLSVLWLVRIAVAKAPLRSLKKKLRKQLEMLGPLRDIQVQIRLAGEFPVRAPSARAFQTYLKKEESVALRKIQKRSRRLRSGTFKAAAARVRKQYRRALADPRHHPDLETGILDALRTALDRVVACYGEITVADPFTVHRMRIALKKLRYMVEAMAPILPGLPASACDGMKALQDQAGEIRDLENLSRSLLSFCMSRGRTESGLAEAHRALVERWQSDLQQFVNLPPEAHQAWKGLGECLREPATAGK